MRYLRCLNNISQESITYHIYASLGFSELITCGGINPYQQKL